MKLKKYLQQKAEKDAEDLLTEDDLQFCMQLAADVQEKPVVTVSKKPKIKLWASLGSAIAVALVAVIVLPVALSRKPDNEIYYKEENINFIFCQLEDFSSNCFEVVQPNNTELSFDLYYDTVSNDKLYYEVKVTTLISNFKLSIVVNKNYDYEFDLSEEFLTEQLDEYSINYKSIEAYDFSDAEAKYKGVINSKTETVYIEYSQLFDVGVQAFFEDIQSVLKVKS